MLSIASQLAQHPLHLRSNPLSSGKLWRRSYSYFNALDGARKGSAKLPNAIRCPKGKLVTRGVFSVQRFVVWVDQLGEEFVSAGCTVKVLQAKLERVEPFEYDSDAPLRSSFILEEFLHVVCWSILLREFIRGFGETLDLEEDRVECVVGSEEI